MRKSATEKKQIKAVVNDQNDAESERCFVCKLPGFNDAAELRPTKLFADDPIGSEVLMHKCCSILKRSALDGAVSTATYHILERLMQNGHSDTQSLMKIGNKATSSEYIAAKALELLQKTGRTVKGNDPTGKSITILTDSQAEIHFPDSVPE